MGPPTFLNHSYNIACTPLLPPLTPFHHVPITLNTCLQSLPSEISLPRCSIPDDGWWRVPPSGVAPFKELGLTRLAAHHCTPTSISTFVTSRLRTLHKSLDHTSDVVTGLRANWDFPSLESDATPRSRSAKLEDLTCLLWCGVSWLIRVGTTAPTSPGIPLRDTHAQITHSILSPSSPISSAEQPVLHSSRHPRSPTP